MSSHLSADRVPRSCLVCRIGERLLAVPLAAVVEIMRPQPIEALPGLPPFVGGVATIRGALLPVIDIGLLVGVPRSAPTRFVTLDLTDPAGAPRGAALAVDAVIGVRTLPERALQTLPPLLDSSDLAMVAAIGTLDADLLLVLDQSHLMPELIWAALTELVTTS